MSSAFKAWSFLAILSLTLVVFGHHQFGRSGLLFSLIGVLAMNSFVYLYEDRRVLSLFHGTLVEGQDSYGLFDIARRLAARARITPPKIMIIPNESPQSAAVGRGLAHGTILITQGALELLTRRELEAMLAYQIASIKLLNTLAFAVGSFVAFNMLFVAEVFDSILRFLIVEKKNSRTAISQVFTRAISPFVGLILRLSIRRSFYKNADKLATELLGDGHILARVLWKLNSYAHTIPFQSPLSAAHIFIVSPITDTSWTRSCIAQPKAELRIRALVGHYPI